MRSLLYRELPQYPTLMLITHDYLSIYYDMTSDMIKYIYLFLILKLV